MLHLLTNEAALGTERLWRLTRASCGGAVVAVDASGNALWRSFLTSLSLAGKQTKKVARRLENRTLLQSAKQPTSFRYNGAGADEWLMRAHLWFASGCVFF